MTELDEFILARIAEDEQAVRRWSDAQADDQDGSSREAVLVTQPTFDYLMRFNPARVLAECDAVRRVLDAYDDPMADDYHGERGAALWHVLCCLALPYADHPDYRAEEWRL